MEIFHPNSKIDFMRLHWVSLGLAALLTLTAIGALATRGLNYALDFTGGTVAELRFEKPLDLDIARERLEDAGYVSPVVQTFGSANDIVVRLQSAADQVSTSRTGSAVLNAIQPADNPGVVVRSDFVGPQVGKELAINGIYAMLFVTLGFAIYIMVRFEWKFAVAAILATLHDVLLTTGLFAITQHEFDLAVMAGILSIMGFSINDTIVVFDRVRENFRAKHKDDTSSVLNRSINQTLSRTVITSVVAFLTVLALYLYGGSSLEGMALSQMVGIVIGTLSSIFVACPLLWWLGVSKQDLVVKLKDDAELARRP